MKIVLVDTRNGLMLQESGKYTAHLQNALGFEDTAVAAEFRERRKLSSHNVALRFSDCTADLAETHVTN
jgi:hypothetical protein